MNCHTHVPVCCYYYLCFILLQNIHCSHPTIYFTILATNLRLSPIVKDSEQCGGSLAERRTSRGLEDRGSKENRLRHRGDSRLEIGGHTATGGDKTPKRTDHDKAVDKTQKGNRSDSGPMTGFQGGHTVTRWSGGE